MRIVGGALKGRRLRAPSSIPARPTTDYAKESLFNILHHQLDWTETDLLDLFAGIGSISFEAASRGARQVVAVDLHHASIRWIQKTASELQLDQLTAIRSDALKWLEHGSRTFELVFADPPYEFAHYTELITHVLNTALTPKGLFILEHRQSGSFEEHPNFVSDRTYGEVRFSFFKRDVS